MALIDELLAATDGAEIVCHVARATWAAMPEHRAAQCPPDRIPTPAMLAEWLPECPPTEREHADAVLTAVSGAPAGWQRVNSLVAMVALPEAVAGAVMLSDGSGGWQPVSLAAIPTVHRRWCAADPRPRRHPLAPLVAAWQAAQPIERDRRKRGVLPDSWRRARYHDHLPLLQRPYPEAPGMMAGDQHLLPLAELKTPSVIVPVLPLALYDSGAGPLASRGRGAPYAQRLFVEILLDVGRLDRVPGRTARVEVPLRDLVTWLWPNGWKRTRKGERPGDLAQLQRALLELDGTRILWDRMLWRLVGVQALPTATTRLDDLVVFRVEHLPGSEHGPMIDRDAVRRWGAVSAPAWRASLRLSYLWDAAKLRNHGARIYATRPVVARGAGGVILGAGGAPLRDRRRAMVTDWSDRRAVILGADGKPAGAGNPPAYERNPAADRVPVLGPDDVIRLAYDDSITRSNRRERLRLAREALRAKEAAGEVVVERDGEGWRIIETRRDP